LKKKIGSELNQKDICGD